MNTQSNHTQDNHQPHVRSVLPRRGVLAVVVLVAACAGFFVFNQGQRAAAGRMPFAPGLATPFGADLLQDPASETPTASVAEATATNAPPVRPTHTPASTQSPTEVKTDAPPPVTGTSQVGPFVTPTSREPGVTPTGQPDLRTPVLTPPKPTVDLTALPTPEVPPPGPTEPVTPGEINGPIIDGEVIVRFRPETRHQEISRLFDAINATWTEQIPEVGVWHVGVEDGSVPYALGVLQNSDKVAFAEPNYFIRAYSAPDDPAYRSQPYLESIQVPLAWEITTGSPDVLIAIIDTGIDAGHPDLAEKLWLNPGETGKDGRGGDRRNNGRDDDGNGYVDDWLGWNAVENNGEIEDQNGHGTHLAGIAAAGTDNGLGMAGVAWRSRLLPVKALDANGEGGYAQVAKAIVYAVRQRARVINLSMGGLPYSALLDMAVDFAYANGAVVVAAAGEAGLPQPLYPAAYDGVLAVGAAGGNNQPADFSAVLGVDVFAPGVDILSTFPGGEYRARSGSSQAAAHVSGVAALLYSLPQFTSPSQVSDALVATSLRSGERAGLVQAYAALVYGANAGTPTVTPTPTEPPAKAVPIYPMLPTAVLPPPQPTTVPIAADPHVNYNATTDSCAGCHRGHVANGIVLRKTWPEEQVCFSCHTAGGTGTNVQPGFTSYTNTTVNFYKHDIALTNGIHHVGENTAASFGGANRHVECEDCHESHEATRGAAVAPAIQREMTRITGVDPDWTLAGAPPAYTWLAQADREYQVCFKCHSGYASLPTYSPGGWNGTALVANGLPKLTSANARQILDSRNMAQEFNPNNSSFHPVASVGRNTLIPAASFVAGWSVNSLVYCSDCHANANAATQGVGPHGSPRLHILGGTANYYTVDNNFQPAAGEVCFQCHQYAVYASNGAASSTLFRDGGTNLHNLHVNGENTPCYLCHDSHGSEQLHLINFDTSVVSITAVGRNSQNAWELVGNTRTCYLACHGTTHSTDKSYTP